MRDDDMGLRSHNRFRDKEVFTTGEAAAICNLSQQTIIRCFDSGHLAGFRVPGSRSRRIFRDALMRFVRMHSIPAAALEVPQKRVLIVEGDRRTVSRYTRAIAADDRFEVRSARTGYDAGVLTEQFRPDLVLVDITLPDTSGELVCKRIKSDPELSDTKVLVTSRCAITKDEARLSRMGADVGMRKPVHARRLVDKIAEVLRL